MSKYKATIIKTGNSYALRVPKEYIKDSNLELGQKVFLPFPSKEVNQDRKLIQKLFKQLQEIEAYKGIKDPSSWQREIRKDRNLLKID